MYISTTCIKLWRRYRSWLPYAYPGYPLGNMYIHNIPDRRAQVKSIYATRHFKEHRIKWHPRRTFA